MKKKILSILISLVLVISVMPLMTVTAFAVESIWTQLNRAMSGGVQETVPGQFEVDDSTSGIRKIKLLNNIVAESGDTALVVKSANNGGKKIILDLNNCYLVRGLAEHEGDISNYETGNVIRVLGGELVIDDTSAGKMGMLFGGKACQGGGIYNDGGTVTINQCVIMSCSAEYSISDPDYSGNGGGIYNDGKLSIENCSIQYCSAYCGGGGIYYKYDSKDLKINNSTIKNCVAAGKAESCGGAIYNDRNSIDIDGLRIANCEANRYGGGIFNTGKVTLKKSEIGNCQSIFNDESCGGAIYNSGAYYPNDYHNGELVVSGTTIDACKTSFRGAGIYNGGKAVLVNTEIKNCGTTMYNGEGGGVYNAENATSPIGLCVGGKTIINTNAIDDGPVNASKIPNNIYLAKNMLLTIGTGSNGVAAPNQMAVGVTKENSYGIGTFTANGTENDTVFFSSDISTYTIDKNSNNEPIINGHYTIDYIKETITPDSGYELLNSSFELISLVGGKTSAEPFTKYFIRKSGETVAPGFYTPYRSIQPLNAPTLSGATDSTITINANDGEEYLCLETATIPDPLNTASYDADCWNSAISGGKLTFSGLKASTSYTIYCRVKAITTEGSEKFASAWANDSLVASTTAAPVYEPDPTVEVPVFGSDHTIEVQATLSGKTARIQSVSDADIERIIRSDVATGIVEFDLTELNRVTNVYIPTKVIEKISDATKSGEYDAAGFRIKLSGAEIEFNAEATQKIAEQAKGSSIRFVIESIKESSLNSVQKKAVESFDKAIVLNLSIYSNGKEICTEELNGFDGGKATVILPYELKNYKTPAYYKLYYVDKQGKLELLEAEYDKYLGSFIFETDHFSNYVLAYDEEAVTGCEKNDACPASVFEDVNLKSWYHDGVHFCVVNEIMNGVGENRFAPTGTISRAELVTMLWRLEGRPFVDYLMFFEDIDEEAFYAEAVRWAAAENIIGGYTTEQFGPTDPITREQIATILERYAEYKGEDIAAETEEINTLSYDDIFEVSEWAQDGMHYCIATGIIEGNDEKVRPHDNCSRAEAATMLYRFCNRNIEQ